MSINEILNSGANVSFNLTAVELKEFLNEQVIRMMPQPADEVFMTANQVCAYTGKVRSTLWTWEKRGYLKPSRIGKELRYKKSEIDLLMGGSKK